MATSLGQLSINFNLFYELYFDVIAFVIEEKKTIPITPETGTVCKTSCPLSHSAVMFLDRFIDKNSDVDK